MRTLSKISQFSKKEKLLGKIRNIITDFLKFFSLKFWKSMRCAFSVVVLSEILILHKTRYTKKNEVFNPGFFSVNVTKPVDLVTFTEELFNGKLHVLCSEVN